MEKRKYETSSKTMITRKNSFYALRSEAELIT